MICGYLNRSEYKVSKVFTFSESFRLLKVLDLGVGDLLGSLLLCLL